MDSPSHHSWFLMVPDPTSTLYGWETGIGTGVARRVDLGARDTSRTRLTLSPGARRVGRPFGT